VQYLEKGEEETKPSMEEENSECNGTETSRI
jgi:hypothetical protein